MDKRNYAFGRTNFILIAAGMVVVVLGFILMAGSSSTEEAFNPDIFSTMRIKVAPIVCLVGFLSLIFGIVYKPKTQETDLPEAIQSKEVVKEAVADKTATRTMPPARNNTATKPQPSQKQQKRRR